jgi:carbonic anhydrase
MYIFIIIVVKFKRRTKMNKILTYSTGIVLGLFLITGCGDDSTATEENSTTKAHWGYEGDVAPAKWGTLDTAYKTCSEGKIQSPINILPSTDENLTPLDLNYTASASSIIDNGHTVQVNIEQGSTFTIGNDIYALKQFHFHTPSENNIKDQSFPLEAHFVHATSDGKLTVIAVMFEEGVTNTTLDKIWKTFPLEKEKEQNFSLTVKEIASLMPVEKDYYKFMGSLTTPPCTEGVKWHVLKQPLIISVEQKEKFINLFGHKNNRPIQDTNERIIVE